MVASVSGQRRASGVSYSPTLPPVAAVPLPPLPLPPSLPAGLLALGDLHGVSTHEVPVAGPRAEGEADAPAGGPTTVGQAMPDLELAAELALTCRELYRRSPAGLAPEIVYFANVTGERASFHGRQTGEKLPCWRTRMKQDEPLLAAAPSSPPHLTPLPPVPAIPPAPASAPPYHRRRLQSLHFYHQC